MLYRAYFTYVCGLVIITVTMSSVACARALRESIRVITLIHMAQAVFDVTMSPPSDVGHKQQCIV
jgi:hypothetical protein